jgi:hypothetical protein
MFMQEAGWLTSQPFSPWFKLRWGAGMVDFLPMQGWPLSPAACSLLSQSISLYQVGTWVI